ncbi:MAG: DUF2334 domain-containing protein [Prochlorococcus marinus XMU1422]|nr:DUF2334 domain-containing protein [Prochlorococcus marinus XMU1421]MBO7013257.1 DUF2334 domain-containing protein [Prochlorococcus marinus XMU1422]MCR8542288.1 DUF2334 domain-containing protein [Prochlorococcus marinus XMU1423]
MDKKIEIFLRDDDYCSYTDSNTLYELREIVEVFDRVYFGTIPYPNELAVSYLPSKQYFRNIIENHGLVDYLMEGLEHENVSLALHGVTHSYPKFPEFNYPIPEETIIKSKEFLERKFKTTINAFSPPNNSLSVINYKNLSKFFSIIFYAFCPLPNERPFDLKYYKYFIDTSVGYIFLKYQFRNLSPLIINKILNLSSFTFYKYDTVDSVFKSFKNSLEFSKRLNLKLNPLKISIAIHYWELDKKKYHELFNLTEKIRDYYLKYY